MNIQSPKETEWEFMLIIHLSLSLSLPQIWTERFYNLKEGVSNIRLRKFWVLVIVSQTWEVNEIQIYQDLNEKKHCSS
jgi:hypothetical protein